MQGKVVVPKLRDSECLKEQGISSHLATKLSTLAPGLEWASSRNQSHPLRNSETDMASWDFHLQQPQRCSPMGREHFTGPSVAERSHPDRQPQRLAKMPNSGERSCPTSVPHPRATQSSRLCTRPHDFPSVLMSTGGWAATAAKTKDRWQENPLTFGHCLAKGKYKSAEGKQAGCTGPFLSSSN